MTIADDFFLLIALCYRTLHCAADFGKKEERDACRGGYR